MLQKNVFFCVHQYNFSSQMCYDTQMCYCNSNIDLRLAKISQIVHQLQNPKITFTVTFPQLVALADIFLNLQRLLWFIVASIHPYQQPLTLTRIQLLVLRHTEHTKTACRQSHSYLCPLAPFDTCALCLGVDCELVC